MAPLISGFSILICLPFSYQYWSMNLSPNPYPIGETNVTLHCYSYERDLAPNVHNLSFEFRLNKNHEWLSVAYLNKSGVHRIQGDSEQYSVSFLSFYSYSNTGYHYVYINAYVTVHTDRYDKEYFPSFRCCVFNGSIFTRPERSVLSLKEYWSVYLSPNTYPIGESNISLRCSGYDYVLPPLHNLTFEFRQNKYHEWSPVVYLNTSGIHRIQENSEQQSIHFLSFSGSSNTYYYSFYMYAFVTIHADKCIVNEERFPSFRCLASNGNIIISPERSILSLKGRLPERISGIKNLWPKSNLKTSYEVGDVLQLQCTGEVESINSTPSKNIRWCRKEKELFRPIIIQDHLTTYSTVYRSKDGCTLMQESAIFYHITNRDTDLEVMCETGYNSYYCGVSGINSSVSIPTAAVIKEVQKWKMSPILIHNRESWLNPQHVEVNGVGTTIHLLSTVSIISQNSSLTKNINWCVRKHGHKNWTSVVLQEGKKEAVWNSSGEIKIFSEIIYHVTRFDTDIDFMCEISKYSTCGTGFASSNISLQIIHVDGSQQQGATSCSVAGLAFVTVLLILLVVFIILCLLVLFRRKEIQLCGWMVKIDRSTGRESKIVANPISNSSNQNGHEQRPQANPADRLRNSSNTSSTLQSRTSERSTRYVVDPTSNNADQNKDENISRTNPAYQSDTDENPSDEYEETECRRDSFYENQALEHERHMKVYEDLNKDSAQQDYDDLKF